MGRRLPPDGGPDAAGPGPDDPLPIEPRPPRPPIPWTPFGPGDNATPNVDEIVARANDIRGALEKVQRELTGMRDGPGPDGTPPVIQEVSRADGLWPFLVIRAYPGDVGARPWQPTVTMPPYSTPPNSPDLVLTDPGPATEPKVVDRSGIEAIKARELNGLRAGFEFDLWVHVWNLGRFQATGVRVNARLDPFPHVGPIAQPQPRSLGGVTIDLGDREKTSAHLMVKAATFSVEAQLAYHWVMITATAECLTDPATGDVSPGADRHSAHCVVAVNT